MKTTNQFKLGLKCKYFMSKSSRRRIPNKEGCKSGEMISTSQHTSHHHIKVELKKKKKLNKCFEHASFAHKKY